ncbi:uncharacterized protein LOC144146823 isoform X5 [Haemaphysalis longicornis]
MLQWKCRGLPQKTKMRPATSPALLVLLLSAAVLASFVPVGRSRSIIGREEIPANNAKDAAEQLDSPEDEEYEYFVEF